MTQSDEATLLLYDVKQYLSWVHRGNGCSRALYLIEEIDEYFGKWGESV